MNIATTVFETVRRHADERPQASALSGAGRHWSYGQLRADAERLAAALVEQGAAPGETFAIVADNHPATSLAWLAGARSGTLPSIVNSLLQERELAWILGNLDPRIVIVDAAHLELVRAALGAAHLDPPVFLNRRDPAIGIRSIDDLIEASSPWEGPLPRPEDAFEITYTSGTTSNPKGVVLTHQAVLHRADQQQAVFDLGPQDAAIAATPLFHQSGSRDCVLLMWRCGGHAAVAAKFSASNYWKEAIRVGATYTCMVETMALMLERQPPNEDERRHRIRVVMGGGAPDLRERAEARFGVRFVGGYGMTECGFPIVIPRDLSPERTTYFSNWAPGANFAGWPVGDNEARVVDAEGHDVAEGKSGEILIRSKNLLREYHRNPEATAAALRDGWLYTGDMGLRGPQDSVYFIDRIRDVIRRGGENLASKEVEDVLQSHPSVARAVVYPVPDPVFIQEVKAIVIVKAGESLDARAVWAWCDTRLAKYKRPRYVEFRETIPMSGSGRAQKAVLREEPIAGMGGTFDRETGRVV